MKRIPQRSFYQDWESGQRARKVQYWFALAVAAAASVLPGLAEAATKAGARFNGGGLLPG